tara:strand:- start:1186 stop:1335 length:150 start_codon:yes stop_codon:yes gene_type:complete
MPRSVGTGPTKWKRANTSGSVIVERNVMEGRWWRSRALMAQEGSFNNGL